MASIRKKIVMVGDEKCGKRKLMESLSANESAGEHPVEISDHCRVEYANAATGGKQVNFDIVKTVHDDQLMLRQYSYFDADLILITFSTVDRLSFKKIIDKWIPEVKHFRPDVPFLIIGCKKDLRFGRGQLELEEAIRQDEGKALAKKFGAVAYLECSAVTTEGVSDVLDVAARCTLQEKKYEFNNVRCTLS